MTWRHQRERSNRAMLVLARHLTRALPRGVARWLLVPAVMYFVATSSSARQASRAYLARVLPRRPSLLDIHRHFFAFATVVLDRAYLVRDALDPFAFAFDGVGHVDRLRAVDAGAFLVGAHLGSFEALRALGRDAATRAGRPVRITMVMFEDNARMINETLAALNPSLVPDIIGLGRSDSMLRVKGALDAGALVGMLADRRLDDGDAADQRSLPFLGSPAAFPSGPFRMAALLRRPLLLMLGLHEGGNRYRLVFEPIADFSGDIGDRGQAIDAAMRAYVARIEHYCRRYPYNWFNFFDVWQTAAPPVAARRDGTQPA